jgi:predicted membrane protein
METNQEKKGILKTEKSGCSSIGGGIFAAFVFIFAGLLFLGRNLGIVDPCVSRIIISWQMLLIVIGLFHLFRRHFIGGLFFIGVGGFFLVPLIMQDSGWVGTCSSAFKAFKAFDVFTLNSGWVNMWWPVLIIFGGVLLLLKAIPFFNKKSSHQNLRSGLSYSSEDGFVVSENVFGGAHQIVLDPVFKGARIKNVFGGTVLDLRKTTLEAGKTYIDIECIFGGMEIFVPSEWVVINELETVFGGSSDKRYVEKDRLDHTRKLVLHGKLVFGGIEIKN